jgi:hypothetical protein
MKIASLHRNYVGGGNEGGARLALARRDIWGNAPSVGVTRSCYCRLRARRPNGSSRRASLR